MSVLKRIFDERRADVARAKAEVPLAELKARAREQDPVRDFLGALQGSLFKPALIAEIKPASPSQGAIAPGLDPVQVARAYARADAQCLSVLTEPRHFGGSLENLAAARAACALPVLRKDFIDDPYQIVEARAWGADAVLLIVAALVKAQINNLQNEAWELGMEVLVEVHSESEMETALSCGAKLIGVNSRDLSTLQTDLAVSERLLPMGQGKALTVAESALSTHHDVLRVQRAGADAVLIGTAFCASPDIEAKVREVMGR